MADFRPFCARRTLLWTVIKNEPTRVRRWVSPFWNQYNQHFLLLKGDINLETSILLFLRFWVPFRAQKARKWQNTPFSALKGTQNLQKSKISKKWLLFFLHIIKAIGGGLGQNFRILLFSHMFISWKSGTRDFLQNWKIFPRCREPMSRSWGLRAKSEDFQWICIGKFAKYWLLETWKCL